MNEWIDAHVHLFPAGTDSPTMPRHGSKPNTPDVYLQTLGEYAPKGIVVVHFSKAPDSRHVIGTLDALKDRHPAAGVVKADDREVFDWILREDIKGVRIYAKESMPDFSNTQAWYRLWNLVRSRKKHILIFGGEPHLRKAVALLPRDIPLVIDHLGLPNVEKGISDPAWNALLQEMKSRNQNAAPVYFKGPGYRTSLSPEKVQPFVNRIIETLGPDRLLLGASDAPFAGPAADPNIRYKGQPLGELADLHWIRDYTAALARRAASDLGLDEAAMLQALLHDNTAKLYGF
jgi:predicted TIM-barrel fold metal-dependent hydrolase